MNVLTFKHHRRPKKETSTYLALHVTTMNVFSPGGMGPPGLGSSVSGVFPFSPLSSVQVQSSGDDIFTNRLWGR